MGTDETELQANENQEETSGASEQEQAEEQEVEYISKKAFQETLNEALQQQERKFQGMLDKSASRLDKRIEEANKQVEQAKAMLELSGMKMTAEQESILREKVIQKAIASTGVETSPGELEQKSQAQVHPVVATALEMMRKSGVQIEKDDPEYGVIDHETTDEFDFLASVKKAIQTKQARLSRPKGQSSATPGDIGTGGAASKTALADKYKQEMLAAKGQGMSKAREIQAKYAKLGVPVEGISLVK